MFKWLRDILLIDDIDLKEAKKLKQSLMKLNNSGYEIIVHKRGTIEKRKKVNA